MRYIFQWSAFFAAITVAVLLLAVGCGRPAGQAISAGDSPQYDAAFWKHWGDGKAELAGYELTYPRYSELRAGVAVTIFVTETFSNSLRVKADPGNHRESDEYPVMKLNLVQDFQTGIYDYNNMLSSFVALAPVNGRSAGSPTKISFSSQEWCGHAYQQLLFDATSVRGTLHSYFDGEADQQRGIAYPDNGVSEDVLLLWARGLAGPVLRPGDSRTVPLLMSLQSSRERHNPVEWTTVTLSRSATSQELTVPAGSFEVELWSAQLENDLRKTFYVEKTPPHCIVEWETSAGERADLLGVERLEYWKMNGKGGEEALRKLGLSVRGPRTP
jgi:hypothetical protein